MVVATAAVVVVAMAMAVEREESVRSLKANACSGLGRPMHPTRRYQPLELATTPVAHHVGQRLYINDEQRVAPASVKRLTGYAR